MSGAGRPRCAMSVVASASVYYARVANFMIAFVAVKALTSAVNWTESARGGCSVTAPAAFLSTIRPFQDVAWLVAFARNSGNFRSSIMVQFVSGADARCAHMMTMFRAGLT